VRTNHFIEFILELGYRQTQLFLLTVTSNSNKMKESEEDISARAEEYVRKYIKGNVIDFSVEVEVVKSFIEGYKSCLKAIDQVKQKHGSIFENKTYEELKSETLEVKKLSPIERIGYLIEMYEKERERLMVILKPYYQKQQYAEAKEYQDRMNHITEFIAQLKIIK